MTFRFLVSAIGITGLVVYTGCRGGSTPADDDHAMDSGLADAGEEDGDGGEGGGVGGAGGSIANDDQDIVYPPELLCPEPPHTDPRCGQAFDPGNRIEAALLEQQLTEGLAVWRFLGQGGACVGCHSPDGFELARVGYTDGDIRRRALDHVDDTQADALVAYIHALRQRHAMTWLLHPARFRPLQPTHLSFTETTPGLEVTDPAAQVERDTAFMHHLREDRQLIWATDTIDSLTKARAAYDELHGIDLVTLRIGLPFDRLSEDGFHGEPHLSVFEWFPAMASDAPEAMREQWYALHDAYLADPSDTNLWRFYDQIETMTGCIDDLAMDGDADHYRRACAWMRLKWRSLQVFQHMLRHNTTSYPDMLVDRPGATILDELDLVIERNPIWEAGDVLRVAPLQRPAETACFAQSAWVCTLLPDFVDATIHSNPSYEEARIKQSEVFQQSWFVMSWLRDPALLFEGHGFETFIGDYLESVLLAHYDVHHAFIVAKTAVEKSAASDWFHAPDFRQGTGKIASVRTFSFKQLRNNLSQPAQDSPRRSTYDRMMANFARMWIYLVEEDLRQSGEIYDRVEVLYAVRYMRTWIEQLEGQESSTINDLVRSIENLAVQATELRTQSHRDAYPGTGLQPNGDWDAFAAPYTG